MPICVLCGWRELDHLPCQAQPEPVIGIAPSLVSYMHSFDDVWFGTLSETYDC
jgi:hypothetical protein